MMASRSMLAVLGLVFVSVTAACAPGADDAPRRIMQAGTASHCPVGPVVAVGRWQDQTERIDQMSNGHYSYAATDPHDLIVQPVVASWWRNREAQAYDQPGWTAEAVRISVCGVFDGTGTRWTRRHVRYSVSEIPLVDLYDHLVDVVQPSAAGFTSVWDATFAMADENPNAYLLRGAFVFQANGQWGFSFTNPVLDTRLASTYFPEIGPYLGYGRLATRQEFAPTRFRLTGPYFDPYVVPAAWNCVSLNLFEPVPRQQLGPHERRADYQIACLDRPIALDVATLDPWRAQELLQGRGAATNAWASPGTSTIVMGDDGCPRCALNNP